MKNLFKYTFWGCAKGKYLNLPKNRFRFAFPPPTDPRDRGMQIFDIAKELFFIRKTISLPNAREFFRQRFKIFSHIIMHMGVNLFKFLRSFPFIRSDGWVCISVSALSGGSRLNPTHKKPEFQSTFHNWILFTLSYIFFLFHHGFGKWFCSNMCHL